MLLLFLLTAFDTCPGAFRPKIGKDLADPNGQAAIGVRILQWGRGWLFRLSGSCPMGDLPL